MNKIYTLKRDEFVLKHLTHYSTAFTIAKQALTDGGAELKTAFVLFERQRFNYKKTKYKAVSKCVIVSLGQIEKALPIILEKCEKTYLRHTNPQKWSRYNLLSRVYERAKRGYIKNLPKTKAIYDEF